MDRSSYGLPSLIALVLFMNSALTARSDKVSLVQPEIYMAWKLPNGHTPTTTIRQFLRQFGYNRVGYWHVLHILTIRSPIEILT